MARAVVDITGQRFGRLVATGPPLLQGNGKHALWPCLCDCGVAVTAKSNSLRRGSKRSCGCLSREVGERNREASTTHGMHGSPEYVAWTNMISRCERPSARGFSNYGGRGIKVCSEWRHDFVAFFTHVGPRPSALHSLDRIDNDGDYEPGNVRWTTRNVQNRNTRRQSAVPR